MQLGLGLGLTNLRGGGFDPATLSAAGEQHGVTYNFAAPRPVGQYANGDWWVLGPVSITSISPESTVQTSGTVTLVSGGEWV